MKKFDWKDTLDKMLSVQGGFESLTVILMVIVFLTIGIIKLIAISY